MKFYPYLLHIKPTYLLFDSSLGAFVHYMRLYHKTGKLSETQNASLTELGFDFDVKESAWNTRYEELKAYKEENGHFFVPYSENSVRLVNVDVLSCLASIPNQ